MVSRSTNVTCHGCGALFLGGSGAAKWCPRCKKARKLKPCKICGKGFRRDSRAERCPSCRRGTCSLFGCSRPIHAQDWCRRHYKQKMQGQIPHLIDLDLTGRQRLLAHCTIRSSGCWEWNGSVIRSTNGRPYGRMTLGGGRIDSTHRLSYETWVGPIPPGETIHHKCNNTLCFRPEHLELATHRVNVGEMFARRALEARIKFLEAEVARLQNLEGST